MLKQVVFRICLILTLFGGFAITKLNHKGPVFKEQLCPGDLDARRQCMAKALNSDQKLNSLNFKLVLSESESKPVRGEDLGDVIQVPRIEHDPMSQCVATVRLGDWNEKYIFFSKENPSPMFYCTSGVVYAEANVPNSAVLAQVAQLKRAAEKKRR